MMNKSKTSTTSLLRYGLLIPLLTVLWFYVSPASAQDLNKKEKEINEQKRSTPSTITIKGVRGKADKVNIHVDDALLVNSVNAPLIIIDGVEAVDEVRLDPNDIKSMSVLKDENAEEMYGEKGSNGVVLISLKEDNSENDNRSETPLFSEKEKEHEKISLNPPLIIVDGVEVTHEELKKIASEGIESISVLKDEAAEKVYGERGKKGVIIIKTR